MADPANAKAVNDQAAANYARLVAARRADADRMDEMTATGKAKAKADYGDMSIAEFMEVDPQAVQQEAYILELSIEEQKRRAERKRKFASAAPQIAEGNPEDYIP